MFSWRNAQTDRDTARSDHLIVLIDAAISRPRTMYGRRYPFPALLHYSFQELAEQGLEAGPTGLGAWLEGFVVMRSNLKARWSVLRFQWSRL